mmetsp:Transcript_5841/g.12926  ORF Transcript_5841/g.12926 Transcript_5841/m.12926 type:complete len:310 (-) Transcript_5841:484-1413(-)
MVSLFRLRMRVWSSSRLPTVLGRVSRLLLPRLRVLSVTRSPIVSGTLRRRLLWRSKDVSRVNMLTRLGMVCIWLSLKSMSSSSGNAAASRGKLTSPRSGRTSRRSDLALRKPRKKWRTVADPLTITSGGGALQALLSSMLNSSMRGSLPISTGTWVMRFWLSRTVTSLVHRQRLRGTVVSQFFEASRKLSSARRPMDDGNDWMVLWAILNSCRLSRSPISGGMRPMRLLERSSFVSAVRLLISSEMAAIRLLRASRCCICHRDSKNPSGNVGTWLWLKRRTVRLVSLTSVSGRMGSSFLQRFKSVRAEQ